VDIGNDEILWKSSNRCESGNCVEVARIDNSYAMRDSKDPDGPVLTFSEREWKAFVAGAVAGDLTDARCLDGSAPNDERLIASRLSAHRAA